MEKERGVGGRPAIPVAYRDVVYNGIPYTIGTITTLSGVPTQFLIDACHRARVEERSWHLATGGSYVASTYRVETGEHKSMYLHNFVMNRMAFDGKGSPETIDHINGNGLDNRTCNLRLTTQSLQNLNTRNRVRTTTHVPEGIALTDIPRGIWYCPAHGAHSDRFVVELKGIPDVGDIVRKGTSRRTLTTREKLDHAISIKAALVHEYPILAELARDSERAEALRKECDAICLL